VVLLTGLNLVNFLDRWLIAAVSPSMKRDLGLSDWQTGIVLNAFLVGFMVTSPFFGRLGDVWPRKWLIAGGVAVWCAATAGSGLVSAFGRLVGIRALVGVGEAAYSSLAPTILDDVASPARKGRVLAVYFAAIPIGSALGFVVGGQLDAHFGWRNAFFLAGGPGLLLALLCCFMAEPARAHATPRGGGAPMPLGEALSRLARSRRYAWAVAGAVPQSAVLGCFGSWAPHFLERKLGMAPADSDARLGLAIVVTGFAGTFLGGWLADAVPGKDRLRAAMMVCTATAFVAVPFCFGTLLATTTTAFFTFICLAQVAIWASFSPYNAVVLGAVPPETRATAMAINIFAMHAFGDLPAVPLVGYLSDRFGSLPDAMMILPPLALVGAALWLVAWRVRQ
jgi:MFS family permease